MLCVYIILYFLTACAAKKIDKFTHGWWKQLFFSWCCSSVVNHVDNFHFCRGKIFNYPFCLSFHFLFPGNAWWWIYLYIYTKYSILKHFLSVSSAYVTFSMHFWPLRCLLVSNHSTCFTKIRHQNRGPPRLPRPAFNRRHPPTPPSRHERRRLKETSLGRKN